MDLRLERENQIREGRFRRRKISPVICSGMMNGIRTRDSCVFVRSSPHYKQH